MEEETKTK